MAKDKLTEYDATANNNTVVGDVNLAENSALPSDMNNAVREIMSHQKEAFGAGTPLYVDQTNNRVGVNKTPTVALDVSGDLSVTGDLTASSLNGGQFGGRRNIIINGAMQVAQRGTTGTASTAYSCVDRFALTASTVVWNATQNTDAPSNFNYSTGVTVSTASSDAGAYSYIYHAIEGYNWSQLKYGTASASPSTLSFWVKSSIIGTYGIALRNTGTARFYTTTYEISSADTWEQKTITITGDTSGTWGTTNGLGIQLFWDLGVGSTYDTISNNAWSTVGSNMFGVEGVVKLGETVGATFKLTGVQLEVGSVATPFEHRSYGEELELCKRYFNQIGGQTPYQNIIQTMWISDGTAVSPYYHRPALRATPAITKLQNWSHLGPGTIGQTVSADQNGLNSVQFGFGGGSGGTSGTSIVLRGNNNSGVYITFDAEL